MIMAKVPGYRASTLFARVAVVGWVGPHVGRARDPVRHVEEPRHRRNVPDITIGEPGCAERRPITLDDLVRVLGEFDGEIQHRRLAGIETGGARIGGELPMNTHGGLLSHCHPGNPGSMFAITEAALQLRGAAGARQVAGAEVALLHAQGGILSSHATLILGRSA